MSLSWEKLAILESDFAEIKKSRVKVFLQRWAARSENILDQPSNALSLCYALPL